MTPPLAAAAPPAAPSTTGPLPAAAGPLPAAPSAAQLLADAGELRDVASRLRTAGRASAELLDRVLRIDVPETWVGPWAQACGETFLRWRLAADASATELVDRAKALDARADELEDLAAGPAPPPS